MPTDPPDRPAPPERPAPSERPALSERPDWSKLRSAVDTAAGVTGTLWISYIFLLFYVLLAIVGVTHKDQFLQNDVELPFLQIKLPMLGFFWIGPVIVLLAHAYVLHHLTLLATIARELNKRDPNPTDDEAALLGISLFAQMLAGPARTKSPSAWWVEQVIVWATLVAAPVLTLMYFELQFLPSHDQVATWWARCCMLADLGLLWWMWPRAICRADPSNWRAPELAPLGLGFALLLTVATTYIAIPMATFPGEWLDTQIAKVTTIPGHQTYIVGLRQTDGDKRLIQPLWPNRLFVRGIDLVDRVKYDTPAKVAMAPVTKSMRDRHLEYAVIIEAQLARADFSGAHLQGASLVRADAMGAWFDHADLSGAQLDYADLRGASLFAARLPGATMDSAELQGARLPGANLFGAWLHKARLDGASFAGADLRRATLDESWLVGASLKDANLQGASLAATHLEAASLEGAHIWHADFRQADAGLGLKLNANASHDPAPCLGPPDHACTRADTPATVIDLIRRNVPNTAPTDGDTPSDDSRAPLLARLELPLSPDQPQPWDKESQDRLASFQSLNDKDLPALWEKIACLSKGAPFVIEMLIDTYAEDTGWTRPTTQDATKELVKFILDKDNCTASLAITSDAMRMDLLDLWTLRAASPATKLVTPDSPPASPASPASDIEMAIRPGQLPPAPAPPPR